jgi:ABC-type Fe3+-siderophore transport system permease subunit
MFTQHQRWLIAVAAMVGAVIYAVLAALVPASATEAGVFLLAVEGAMFLALQVGRNRGR